MFCNLFLWFFSKNLQYQLHFSIFIFKCKTSKLGLVKSEGFLLYLPWIYGSQLISLQIRNQICFVGKYILSQNRRLFRFHTILCISWFRKTQGHEFCVIGIYRSLSYFCRPSCRAQAWTFKRHLTNKHFVILLQNMIF